MSRRPRLTSDPALATTHEAGATVYWVRMLHHEQFGAIAHASPRLWIYHFDLAQDGFSELFQCQQRVLALQPGADNIRFVLNEDLLREAYDAGNGLVSNAVRSVQHLANEIEEYHRKVLVTGTVEERIRRAAALFSATRYVDDPNYAGLVELNGIRDEIEHPKSSVGAPPKPWHQVPLSWMLSDRSLQAWRRFHDWFKAVSSDWESYRPTLEKPGTLEVERGLKSMEQVKKSPKTK